MPRFHRFPAVPHQDFDYPERPAEEIWVDLDAITVFTRSRSRSGSDDTEIALAVGNSAFIVRATVEEVWHAIAYSPGAEKRPGELREYWQPYPRLPENWPVWPEHKAMSRKDVIERMNRVRAPALTDDEIAEMLADGPNSVTADREADAREA